MLDDVSFLLSFFNTRKIGQKGDLIRFHEEFPSRDKFVLAQSPAIIRTNFIRIKRERESTLNNSTAGFSIDIR